MLACCITAFGDPSVLRVGPRPEPAADAETAVVQVKASPVLPTDVATVAGRMEGTTLPRIPGRDFSGVVIAGPPEWLGAEVFGSGGRELGLRRDGAHAERLALPVAALVRKPKPLTHEQAACVGVTFSIAWLGAVRAAHLEPGETIVIFGVAGGVGGAVAQIAEAIGARVIGVDKVAPAADSAAGRILAEFIPIGETALAEIRHATGGAGADVVFDAVGGGMFETALGALGPRGRLVEIAATDQRRVSFDLLDLYRRNQAILGASSDLSLPEAAALMAELAPGFAGGSYAAPEVAQTYPLQEAPAAYAAVAGGLRGRAVLCP